MKEKRLHWVEESGSGRYTAHNIHKEMLGYLEYERVGSFMHWCWYQFADIRMSPGCLQEVRDKQKELVRICKKGLKQIVKGMEDVGCFNTLC